MRALVISLVLAAAGFAQEAPKTPAKADQVLDETLKAWEERMGKVDGLSASCRLTETEDGEKAVFTGEVSFMRPNFARLLLKSEADPDIKKKWRNYIADGTDLWDLNHHTKIARASALAKGALDGLVGVVTGRKADDLKKRYELSVDPDNPKQFNAFYIHLIIKPKGEADLKEFKEAELVLWRNQSNPRHAANYMLPARFWYQHVNGNQVTWEFSDLEVKKFANVDFALPKLGADWTVERAKLPTTVSRPK